MISHSTHPSAFPMVMVFLWSLTEPVDDGACEQFSVAEDVVFMTWVCIPLGDGSRIRVSLAADDEMVSWQERLAHARELCSRSERVSDARGHRSVLVGDSLQPIAEDPELTNGRG